MQRSVVGDRHYRIAQGVRECLARYRELEDIIAMLGLEALSESDPIACTARGASNAI